MKYIINTSITIFLIFTVSVLISNADETKGEKDYHHLTPYSGTPEFEKMKSLVGTWQGTTKMGEKEKDITVTYYTASAGSVVVERTFPGTPEEMISVYYDKDGKLSMTHYCALKNQPQMTLKDSNKNRIDLAFSGGSNFDKEKDPYMHSLSIDFLNNDKIIHTWKMFIKGKKEETSTFELSRASD